MLYRRNKAMQSMAYGIVSLFCLVLLTGSVLAKDSEVSFALTDNAGRWFDTGTAIAGNR